MSGRTYALELPRRATPAGEQPSLTCAGWPGVAGGQAGAGPAPWLRLTALARRSFDGPPAIAERPGQSEHVREYLAGLVEPYQFGLRAGEPVGHSYGEMAAALVDELVPADDPVDLLVLAFAVPDVRPGRATATYLGERCPGRPFAFAICDQGSAAAYTGLKLVREYTRTSGCRQALLLLVEQAGLAYHPGRPAVLPAGHYAVGLRCGPTGAASLRSVRQYGDVSPDQVPALLAGEVADAGEGTVVVADPTLLDGPSGLPAAPTQPVAPGRPLTGGWWELAGQSPLTGQLLLADYDRELRMLSLAGFASDDQ